MKNTFLYSILTFILISCGTYGIVSERQGNGKFQASKTARTLKDTS